MSDPRADRREVATVPYNIAFLNPWAEHIEKHGGRVITKAPIQGLVFKEGRVVSTTDEPNVKYDHFVMAADIPGVRKILANSTSDEFTQAAVDALKDRANRIQIAPPYKVMRVWFQGRLNSSRPDILETPQHRPLNLIARYDLLEDEYMEWAEANNGTVIEFHMYNIQESWSSESDPKKIWEQHVSPTAFEIYPELKDMPTLGFTLGQHENFPSYAAKQESFRPTTEFAYKMGVANLALAGDWLKTSYPSALMEKVCTFSRN